jgi:OOP family OmpA-OmpF porin
MNLPRFAHEQGHAMYSSTRKRHLIPSTVAALALVTASISTAYAEDEENPSGPYVGVWLGQFDVTVDNLDGVGVVLEDLDSDDSAWKVAFGWRFNPYLALEADYVDLGTPRGNFDASGSSGDYELDLSGFAGYVIGTLPIGIFELSAKVGYYFHDVNVHVDLDNFGSGNGDVIDSDNSGEAFVYGVGAGVTFFDHLNVKVEYELMDIDEVEDANVLWLSGAWRF